MTPAQRQALNKKARERRDKKLGRVLGCGTKQYTSKSSNSTYKRCVQTRNENVRKVSNICEYDRFGRPATKPKTCRKKRTCQMGGTKSRPRCKRSTNKEASNTNCSMQKSGRCMLRKRYEEKLRKARKKEERAEKQKQQAEKRAKKLNKAAKQMTEKADRNLKAAKKEKTNVKKQAKRTPPIKTTQSRTAKVTKKTITKKGGAPKRVYTKNGKCRDGYVRAKGKKIKNGKHKGEYRCKKKKK